MVYIRINSNIDKLNEQEAHQLCELLEKAGFTDASIGGGASDVVLELEGPEIKVS